MAQIRRWHIYPSVAELQTHAARAILRAAAQAIATRGRFHIVLAGGRTPKSIYARLAAAGADWPHWHVFFGDERCRPVGDTLRNDRAATDSWLGRVAIPPDQIHGIPAEHGPREAARRYAATLAPVHRFDFVLLGLGEDGHTASLFPGTLPAAAADVLPVYDAPKPPPERVTLSAGRLSRARQVAFVSTGEEKRLAIAAWRRGDAVPAGAITPPAGVDILLDTAAWPDRFV